MLSITTATTFGRTVSQQRVAISDACSRTGRRTRTPRARRRSALRPPRAHVLFPEPIIPSTRTRWPIIRDAPFMAHSIPAAPSRLPGNKEDLAKSTYVCCIPMRSVASRRLLTSALRHQQSDWLNSGRCLLIDTSLRSRCTGAVIQGAHPRYVWGSVGGLARSARQRPVREDHRGCVNRSCRRRP
jgi:hypothetical protein